MKANHFMMTMVAFATILFAGCPGTTDQDKSQQDTLARSSSKVKQSFALTAEQQKVSNDRAMQDTLAWRDGCENCSACDNSSRWTGMASGGGVELTPDEARDRVQSFHSAHGDLICGGFISKIALDSLFCHHSNYNGIYLYIGIDDAGKQIMVIEGWADKDESGDSRVKIQWNDHVSGPDKYRFFSTELMCPTICGYAGE